VAVAKIVRLKLPSQKRTAVLRGDPPSKPALLLVSVGTATAGVLGVYKQTVVAVR